MLTRGVAAPSVVTAAPPAVPVIVTQVRLQDFPIYQIGLGNVQAFNTVTVRPRVDGEIMQVAFVEGQEVKAGDVLVQIDPRPYKTALAAATAQKARDSAQLLNAQLDLTRLQNLSLHGYATGQSLDTQTASVHQLTAATEADQAAIDAAQLQLDFATIRSPLNGRTGLRLVDQGNMVRAGDATGLVVITQLRPISVVFTLPAGTVPAINLALASGPLHVEAWSDDDTVRLSEGKLLLVDNQIDPTTGTARLKAVFDNADGRLWPGQFVNAHLLVETQSHGVTVPSQAVQRGPKGIYAWVVSADQRVAMQPITVAQTFDGMALVSQGLAPGQTVVVDGQYKLQPNAAVIGRSLARQGEAETPR